LGFYPVIDKIIIEYDTINEKIDFREEFELADLDNYRKFQIDSDTIWNGATYVGKEITPDAIIIGYRHKTYMNYAYSIVSVDFAKYTNFKVESDLRNDSDTTNSTYYVTFDDIYDFESAFADRHQVPFNKINSGTKLITEFLSENGHPDYVEEIEEND